MGILESILKNVVLEEATISEKVKLSESVYKICLANDKIANADFIPGYFLRLGIGIGREDLALKDKVRSYSVWDINRAEGYIDLAIATHSNGIGSKWVANCNTGDTVYFKWKKGNFLLDETADSYLMIGDLSALSHLYVINRHLSDNKQVAGVVYSQSSSDFFEDVNGKSPFNFYELQQNPYEEIVERIKELTPKMAGKKLVYLAGDSRLCVSLNNYFRRELNWETKEIKTKPFWNPVKKGLE